MGSNILLVSAQKPTVRSVLKMSEDEIKNQIRLTHNQPQQQIDFDLADSLFRVVQSILKPAINVVDNIAQGKPKDMGKENQGESAPKASFIPSCILKRLSCEMACKDQGDEITYKTTMSILDVLSSYPWHVKAVLTLASFALDYGEFSHLADQFDSSDQLTKSLGILKRVPIVLGREGIEKYKNPVVNLNRLIKLTLGVVEFIIELEKLLGEHNTKDVPALLPAIENISIDVFWTIITVVDCMARMSCLIDDKDNTEELSPFTTKITSTHKDLKGQLALVKEQIANIKAFRNFLRDLQSSKDIVEFFKKLFFAKDNELTISKQIEELRAKKVLLFFSDFDISEKVVSILKPICEEKSKKDQYKIVWIPIVKNWTDIVQSKYEVNKKYFWDAVRHFSSEFGIKFVKEVWGFKGKPIVVVLSSGAKVEHPDAFHMIELYGIQAYPFTREREDELHNREDWFGSCIDFIPNVSTWMDGEKYIFLYGGEEAWTKKFQVEATKVKNDPDISSAEISIELSEVRNAGKGKDYLADFLKILNKLFLTKPQKETELNTSHTKTNEIQMLLSYIYMNDGKGWVVLCKGRKLVFSGNVMKVVTVLEKFHEWKKELKSTVFELLLKQRYDEIKLPATCYEFKAQTDAGWVPGDCTKCPECSQIMEMIISFKCCHKGHPTKAVHEEKVSPVSNTSITTKSLPISGSDK